MISRGAFSHCEDLEQVVFEPGSAPEEISEMAFKCSGIKSFVAPPSLRRIGDMAFQECKRLKDVRLNEDIRELGWLCFWGTGVADLKLPPQIEMTPEQLGIGQVG